jgi:hypothetical protein
VPAVEDEATARGTTARDTYVWGYPLVVMHRTRALHGSRTPLGQLHHVEALATPADRTVVAPNNDTLYSSGWYDLAAGDLHLTVPAVDRYWSVMVLDAYTHVGYVSRRTHGTGGADVRITLDRTAAPGSSSEAATATELRVPTPTAWILVRTVVEGPDDLDVARAVQRQITVATPEAHPDHTTPRQGRPGQVHLAGPAFFDELAAALAVDPPGEAHPPPPAGALDLLAARDEIDPDVLAAAVEAGEQVVARGPLATLRRDGWGTNPTGSDFGDDVARRATTAKYALAAHHPAENRSYIAHADGDGDALDGDRALRLRFAPGEPPCDGFWSLTAYGPDGFLVDNDLGRYALGDRTPGLRRDGDGGLTVTVGGARPPDPANWLPAPPGRYALALRVYEGHPQVVDTSWFPGPLRPA